ncbi:MAG: prolipoprotein diacylglyceryl transferase [Bacteroidota bacterium]
MVPAYITWTMDPVAFHLGAFAVRWYSLFLVLSLFICYAFLRKIFLREGRPVDAIVSYGLMIIAGLIIGGRLVHCLFYEPAHYLQHPIDIIKPWTGTLGKDAVFIGFQGMSGHGSAIGIVLAILINSRRVKIPAIWMIDRIALFGPLIGFWTRIGNFFNSEILGTPSDLPWAVAFLRKGFIPRHPVQLYEAAAYALIFVIAYRYYLRKAGHEKPGEILGFVLVLVYVARFFIEFFKAPQAAVENDLFLTMGQILSIPFILTGLFLLLRPAGWQFKVKKHP